MNDWHAKRAATNTVLDHEIHAGQMEEKEALAMMMNEGFQEEGEAVGLGVEVHAGGCCSDYIRPVFARWSVNLC